MAQSKFAVRTKYTSQAGDSILLPYLSARKAAFDEAALPEEVAKAARASKDKAGTLTVFRGKVGRGDVLARSVRLDAEHGSAAYALKKAVAAALSSLKGEEAKRLVVPLDGTDQDLLLAVQEATLLGGYSFSKYLSKQPPAGEVVAIVPSKAATKARQVLADRVKLHDCVNFARDVLNEPPNVIKPPSLAKEFIRMGTASGLKVTVWDDKRLAREQCGGILGVGQGAAAKPRLVIGEYKPRGAKKHLALVGKGVTFDSGGYGLKPADAQIGMKYDMGGAAMMFGAACAIAQLKLPIQMTVLTPLAENDISGEAYHTTSVLTTRTGRTVEVMHTDAEGRLILADALAVAAERKPDWIIDAATLTGACAIALGQDIAGAFGTHPKFTQQLIQAGQAEDELWWEMPLHGPYAELIKCTVADCKNVGPRYGGSITAALFLKQWVPDSIPWIHCDIAGPGTKEEPLGHLGKGAKGVGVRTIVQLARELGR
jgi:leucyl aminopeptidase